MTDLSTDDRPTDQQPDQRTKTGYTNQQTDMGINMEVTIAKIMWERDEQATSMYVVCHGYEYST